ncbi:bifunctional oligoribonuclease/PAP phosphatase NrnA [Polaribacter sp.]|uniref:DHH family phosphoesterase n=1 Tax=Polaribacter sp. TaxID=1920175 RepID=UPI0025EBFD8B|nr:bifunctional oligoribonuclease/PAP phosphatase NrnA [Polaribacter sp.]
MILKGFNDLSAFLETPKNVVIVGHRNPDGDAIGASLALKHYLTKKGHHATVVMPNDYPDFLQWLPGSENTFRFDWQNSQSQKAIQKSEIIFLLDFNTLHRVGSDMQNTLEKYQNDFVMIDHHQQPDDVKFMYSDVNVCSTSQMIYQYIEMNNDLSLIDKDIATCLYTGIMTDTGSFRFRSTTSKTHRIIADLIDKGAQNDRIHNNVYDSNSYNRLLLLGQALSNLQILPEYKTAFITLTDEEKKRFDFQKGDTEGVVNYALSLKGIIFAAIFIEDKEQSIVKISFRSKGTFSVNKFSRNHYNGGGHDNAAGGRSESTMQETVDNFCSLLKDYKTELEVSYEI